MFTLSLGFEKENAEHISNGRMLSRNVCAMNKQKFPAKNEHHQWSGPLASAVHLQIELMNILITRGSCKPNAKGKKFKHLQVLIASLN